ncbi:MAG TPA: hypothetical protein VGE66_03860, partial [Chitinophagaceae bacterium]
MNQMNVIKYLIACLCALAFAATLDANAADTLHLRAFHRQTVVTDPSKGSNYYKAWTKFPSVQESIRKIIMKVTFGCPDSLRCA